MSESSEFAQAVIDAGLIFIGPRPEHIRLFGDKIANEVGYPVMIKAAFGGGGRGMRIVTKASDFKTHFEASYKEALRFFGNGPMFIENYMQNTRHIEIQIIADKFGNVVHLGERDWSIQRRHPKVIEISPSPRLNDDVRRELYRVSTKAMFRLGYESVGTIEYLLDEEDDFFFMEMNTRIQVEHPITEITTGIDLVQRMIEIAGGDKIRFLQEEIVFRGCAIEFRINAEGPKNDFAPHPGTITRYLTPGGPGVRIDTAVYTNYTIPPFYDSMIAKLIVWALDWEGAVKKAKRALDEFYISGVPTNIALHRQIVRDADFQEGFLRTDYLDQKLETFDLDTINAIEQERHRMQTINELIKTIAKNFVDVRY